MRTSRQTDMARLIGEFLQLLCERAKSDTKRRNGNLEPTKQVSDAVTVLPTANVEPWARGTETNNNCRPEPDLAVGETAVLDRLRPH
jgi:hypothetical protein